MVPVGAKDHRNPFAAFADGAAQVRGEARRLVGDVSAGQEGVLAFAGQSDESPVSIDEDEIEDAVAADLKLVAAGSRHRVPAIDVARFASRPDVLAVLF